MRGIPALVLGSFPAITSLHRGVVIISCPDDLGQRVVLRLREWTPGTSWVAVKREEPPVAGLEDATRFTTEMRTLSEQWRFVRELRTHQFDVAVTVWAGGDGYGLLKFLPVLLGARSILVFNEHVDAFYLLARNWRTIRNHWRSRSGGKPRTGAFRTIGRAIRSIFLAPIGLSFVVMKISYLIARKNIRGHS